MKKPELLAPAGNLEKLKIACIYGADAVFLGGQEYGLRSNSDNFSLADIKEGVEFANSYNVDVYVTTNIYAHHENLIGFPEFLENLQNYGVRGIIVSDPAYIEMAKKYAPNLEIHISTQQSITNSQAVKFFEEYGATRVVLARELSFAEIKEISDKTNCELEIFIHGAVCSSYSGRCTLSNHMTMRDSNRGGCTQSCRWNYDLAYLQDDQFKAVELADENTKFAMSAKDMNLINFIPELMALNVDSFKIEGRMKSFHYLATVVKVYRQAIDAYCADPDNYQVDPAWISELQKSEARPTYEGALISDFSAVGQIYNEQYQLKQYDYCGFVKDYDSQTGIAKIEQRNLFVVGDTIEFFGPENKIFSQTVTEMWDEEQQVLTRANHPLMTVFLKTDQPVAKNWMLRKEK